MEQHRQISLLYLLLAEVWPRSQKVGIDPRKISRIRLDGVVVSFKISSKRTGGMLYKQIFVWGDTLVAFTLSML
jgi:hypothetical protein